MAGKRGESQNHLLNCMLDTDASYFIKLSEDSYGAVSLEKDAAFIEYTVTAPESGPLYALFSEKRKRREQNEYKRRL